MKKNVLGLGALILIAMVAGGASAKTVKAQKLNSPTVWLLNGILNGRWANDPAMQKCLADFRALQADVTAASYIAPKGEGEEETIYKLRAERYVKGGKEVYQLTIESGEGAYDCQLSRLK